MYAIHTRHPTSGLGRWVDEALASAPVDRIGIVLSRAMHARRAGFDASVLAFLADDPGRPETYAVESSHLGTEPDRFDIEIVAHAELPQMSRVPR